MGLTKPTPVLVEPTSPNHETVANRCHSRPKPAHASTSLVNPLQDMGRMPPPPSSDVGSRFRALFIDDPSDDEDSYDVPLPDLATACAHSSPTSAPMLQTASLLPVFGEHTPSVMGVGSCLASHTVHGISNVPPDSSIFRERRRPLHVMSLCS
jgi:hypothetical protein